MLQMLKIRSLFVAILLMISAIGLSQPVVQSTSPTKNQNNISASGNVVITFSEAMNQETLTTSTIRVNGSTSGLHSGSISFSGGGTIATFNPTNDFAAGELVTVTVTTGVQNESNAAMSNSYSWGFRTKTSANGSSYTNTTYTTGYGPRDVRIADVDGDGDGDMVVLNYDWDNVSVLKNNGDGTFAAKTDYTLGDNPLFLALADVDNDNDIDIISTNSFGLSLSVLKNNGNGTFAAKVDYATPYQSRTVAASDVNGDGYADLIAPTESKDSVSVFMNNGDGTFADDVQYFTGDGPFGITVADVDGDGDMDLVSSNYASSTISVLKNNGNGTYAAKSDYGTGSSPRALTHADVDNDGDVDMIVAYISGVSSGGVSVLKNNGDGTFATTVDYPTAFGSFNPIAQDVDGDGDIDIVNANAAPGNNFSLLKNNGDGTFAAKVDYLNSTNMYSVAAGDLDGNGIVDFVAGQAQTNLVNVMLNIVPPSVVETSPASNAVNASTSGDIVITFDQSTTINTGKIFVVGSVSGIHDGEVSTNGAIATFSPDNDFSPGEKVTVTLTTAIQNSLGGAMVAPYVFQFNTALKGDLLTDQNSKFSPGTKPYGVAHTDIDGDGDLDMILPQAENDSIAILTNDGSGNYSTLTQIYAGSGTLPYSVSTGDFNSDGSIDFVVTNYSSNNIEVYLNTGSLTFSRTTYGAQSGTVKSVVSDFDGDGDLDVVAFNRNSISISVFLNNGDGTFASAANKSLFASSLNRMSAGDVDSDGDIDILIGGEYQTVYLMKNNGNGTFATEVNLGFSSVSDFELQDINSDRKLDLITVHQTSNKVTVSLGNGNGTFASGVDFAFNNPSSVTFMDLGFDGDIDVLVSAHDGDYYDELYYLTNNGSGGFTKDYGFYLLRTDWEYSYSGYPLFSTADVDGDGDLDLVETSRLGSYVAINKTSDLVTITSFSPVPNSNHVSASTNITATLNYDVDPVTVNNSTVILTGSSTGKLDGTISYNSSSKTITFDPTSNLKPGETVTLSITDSVTSLNGTHLSGGKSTEFIVAQAGDGKGHFELSSSANYETGKYPSSLAVGDLNGDGYSDVVTIDSYNNQLYLSLNNGDGTYGTATSLGFSTSSMQNLRFADIDSDGDLDIIISRYGNSSLPVLLNDGNASFQQAENSVNTFSSYYDNFWSKDLNSDGRPDIIQRYGGSSGPLYNINLGDGTFQGDIKQIDWSSSDLAIVDLDNDGDLDFVMSYSSSGYHRLGIALNNGVREKIYPSYGSPYFINTDKAPKLIRAFDADNDGDIDFVATTTDNQSFFIIKNNSDGTFTTMPSTKLDATVADIEIGDLNSDGDMDIAFIPDDNGDFPHVNVAYNKGDGTFDNSAAFNLPDYSYVRGVKLTDADGDGDLDLVALTGSYVDSDYIVKLGVYENKTSAAPTTEASSISYSQNLGSKITLNWTKGNGTRHMVVMKAGSAVSATPEDNTDYSINANFGDGANLGGGNYVVYNGGGNSVTVSGLSLNTQYHVAVFELNGNEGDELFYTSNAPIGSFTTNAKDGYPFDTTPGKALSFNGSSSIAEFAYNNDLPKDITIQMWVKVADSSNVAAFFVRGDDYGLSGGDKVKGQVAKIRTDGKSQKIRKNSKVTSNGESEYYYPIHLGIKNGFLYASIYDDDNGDPVTIVGTDTVNSNEWYHVALTMHGDPDPESYYVSGTFYVNGNVVGTYDNLYYNDYTGSFMLGYDSDVYFHGELDELQIRDKILTTAEIRASMHTTLTGFPSNLLGYWQFNEGTGTTSSQLINSDKFYFENVGWVNSNAPIGEGTVSAASGFSTGTQAVGKATLNMADGFDNPVDITVTEVAGDPNQFPEGYSASVGGKVFVIELFGNPGTFSANLTLNYGAGVITSEMENNPASVILYKRPSTSTGSWTELGGAVYANASTGDVRWEGITSFSQFIAGNSATVPVELNTFAFRNGSLVWETKTETGNYGWEVERREVKAEKTEWNSIGFVAGKGTTTEQQAYSFKIPAATTQKTEYRLKQIDLDGSFGYSKVIEVTGEGVPAEFALAQNYPNPFNPTTTIKFTLLHDGLTTLKVFNMLGQEVATLVNEELKAGEVHQVTFNAQSMSSGIYFVKLESGTNVQIRKMTLLK